MTPDEVNQVLQAISRLEGRFDMYLDAHEKRHKEMELYHLRYSRPDNTMARWEGARQLFVYLLTGTVAIAIVTLQAVALFR